MILKKRWYIIFRRFFPSFQQNVYVDRLGQKVIHPACQRQVPVLLEGVGCTGVDLNRLGVCAVQIPDSRDASQPSMTGICISIRMIPNSPISDSRNKSTASRPFWRGQSQILPWTGFPEGFPHSAPHPRLPGFCTVRSASVNAGTPLRLLFSVSFK